MTASLPADEEARLDALRRYAILDTEPEQDFDDLTRLAAQICGTPIAVVSFIDERRQWFKSKVGLSVCETSRDVAFSAHTILQRDVFVVEDALADQRFASNPFVLGEPGIRFYAGAPLLTADGHALGALCVMDRVPRNVSAAESTALQALARQVIAQLELRRSVREQREFAAHEDSTARKLAETALRESNEKFHQLANHLTDAFWMRSADLREVHYLSPAFERIWGRSAASLYANPHEWTEFIFPEDRERVVAIFATLTQDAPSVDVEYRIVRPTGEIRWIRSRGFQVRDAAGKLVRTTGIVTDITERKQIEEAMRESEERFSGAFEHAPIGVALVSPDGRFMKVNKVLCALVGYTEEELLNRTFQDITHPEDLDADLQCVRQVLADEIRTYQIEKRYIHQRGNLITVSLDVSLVAMPMASRSTSSRRSRTSPRASRPKRTCGRARRSFASWRRRCRKSSGSRAPTAGTRISISAGWTTPA
jgi:PAS domain S-box-containing protein